MRSTDGSIWLSIHFNVGYKRYITHNSVAIILCYKFIRAFLAVGKLPFGKQRLPHRSPADNLAR